MEWVVNMASEYDMWELIEVNGVSASDYFNIYADEFVGMYKGNRKIESNTKNKNKKEEFD